ncbi:MAG: hypothetical protein AB2A00_37820 [Myxococcota bacterium]
MISLPVLAGAFFFSGAAALMLEVVWSRGLHHLFGGSALATSAVLTAYMGGLAAGSFLLAPIIRRRLHPALAYGLMELGIGAYALVVPTLLDVVGKLHIMLSPVEQGPALAALLRFLLAILVLLVPTALMGATLPCLADLMAGHSDERANQVGTLYAANTFGAVAGTLAATFAFFPAVGVHLTNVMAAGVDALVGIAAVAWWNSLGRPVPVVAATTSTRSALQSAHLKVLWVYGMSGAVAMALEVVWTRSLAMVLGSSVHAFSLMLAAFLSGLAVGARVASSKLVSRLDPTRALAMALMAAGMLAFAGTWLIDGLPEVLYVVARRPDLSILWMWSAALFCSALVMFPAAVGFGAILPLALRAASPDGNEQSLGDLVGRAYAINTVGSIVGSATAGFVLAPGLGVDRAAQALSVLLLGTAALTLASRSRVWTAVALGASVLICTWDGFDVARWSAGAFRVYLARAYWDEGIPDANVVFRKDGLSTTVTVEENEGRISLKVNGKVDASSEGDMPTQVLSGLLPVLLHPNPERMAIVGFGSGVTSDAALSHSGLKELEMIELEPAVVEAGEFFYAVNHRPWEDPRYKGIFDDGRHHLLRPGNPYDIIISEPSNPWITGASSLFTQDFWRLARSRLGPDGIFLQWVQLYEMAPERIQSLMATFADAFPHVVVFASHPESNDTLLIGSNAPIALDEALVRRRWEDPKVRAQLNRADLHTPLDVAALVLMDEKGLRDFTRGATINTDDNLFVELHAPVDLINYAYKEPELPFLAPLAGKRPPLVESIVRPLPTWKPAELKLALADVMLRAGLMKDARAYAVQLVGEGGELEAGKDRILAAIDLLEGDDEVPVADEEIARSGDQRYLRSVQAMVEGNDARALQLFEGIPGLEDASPGHRMLYAYLLYRGNWRYRARRTIDPLLSNQAYVETHPEVLYYGARIYWLLDENQRAARLALRYLDQVRNQQKQSPLDEILARQAR